MPVLVDPLPRPTALLLRAAVRTVVAQGPRRRFAPVLHLWRRGTHGVSAAATLVGTDHAVRTDVVAALLGLGEDDQPLLWLGRPGELTVHDLDQAWLAAVLGAAGEAGLDPTWVVVTRHGWRDPRSGVHREWRRLRD